jgi:hypothetical protein
MRGLAERVLAFPSTAEYLSPFAADHSSASAAFPALMKLKLNNGTFTEQLRKMAHLILASRSSNV